MMSLFCVSVINNFCQHGSCCCLCVCHHIENLVHSKVVTLFTIHAALIYISQSLTIFVHIGLRSTVDESSGGVKVREKIGIQGCGKCWISVENFLWFWQFLQKVCAMFLHPFSATRMPHLYTALIRAGQSGCVDVSKKKADMEEKEDKTWSKKFQKSKFARKGRWGTWTPSFLHPKQALYHLS